jgi:uncharacterized protein
VRRDQAQARLYFERCARGGHSHCMGALGSMLARGQGGPTDRAGAEYWLDQAFNYDDSEVANAYESLRGQRLVAPARTQSDIPALQRLAEGGNGDAQLAMANWYLFNAGGERDWTVIRRWMGAAAEGGNRIAQRRMGVINRDGLGAPADQRAAVRWFRLAALQGDSHGISLLGAAYSIGAGVPRDLEIAYRLIALAVMMGDASAMELRMLVGARISAAKYREAEALARRCLSEGVVACGIIPAEAG